MRYAWEKRTSVLLRIGMTAGEVILEIIFLVILVPIYYLVTTKKQRAKEQELTKPRW